MDMENKRKIEKYADMDIEGMHYVRKLKNKNKEFSGVIVIDNNNKPVEKVYKYLKHLYRLKGYALNSLTRVVYDICYFLDFMLFNNLNEENIKYDDMFEFLDLYLTIIDSEFYIERCIQRSMLKKIPILEVYTTKKIKIISNMDIGLDDNSRIRILNNVKEYLVFLKYGNISEVKLEELFEVKVRSVYRENTIGNRTKELYYGYSIKGYLKRSGISKQNNKIEPVEVSNIFEPDEERCFFNNITKIQYKLLFNLLNNTGLRISEVLGLKLFAYKKTQGSIDCTELDSDIKLINTKENIWEVSVIPRKYSPTDLRVKFNKARKVRFLDSTLHFKNILEDYIRYREYMLKKKKKKHDYLFINARGERLRYDSVYKTINKVLLSLGMEDRINYLTPHSFRHTFATKWIKSSIELGTDTNLELLAEQLGHSNSEVTKRTYYHIFEQSKKELSKKLEENNYYLREDKDE